MPRVPAWVGSGRAWWWSFAVLIVAPALALALLGWRAVRAERIERDEQWRGRQMQTARLVDAAIANAVAEWEAWLRSGGERPPAPATPRLLYFDRRGVVAFPGARVYFGEFGARPPAAAPPQWSPHGC